MPAACSETSHVVMSATLRQATTKQLVAQFGEPVWVTKPVALNGGMRGRPLV